MRNVSTILKQNIAAFIAGQRGATAIEYALMAAGIALGIIVVVFLMGDDVLGLFEDVQSGLSSNL